METHPRITTKKSSYNTKLIKGKKFTYYVPGIPQITMRPHHKPHCNDLQYHLSSINKQKHKINSITISSNNVYFSVNGEEKAVYKNNYKNEPIKPWVDGDKLDDLVSERVGHREAAERDGGVVLLLDV
jgi:hypothetical protein